MPEDLTNQRAVAEGIRSVRRIAWRKRLTIVGVICLIAMLYVADQRGWLLSRRNDDLSSYHGITAAVTRIIDGDTIEVDIPDALTAKPASRIRLWGVNAPEPASGNRPAQPFADQATELVSQHLKGASVTLWLEAHQTRDPFGSVLAHLELSDGSRLNETMVEAGLALVDERWPHTMLTRYAQLEHSARRRGAGVWSLKKPR